MALAALLLPDPVQQSRVRAALRARYGLLACADWAELLRTCTREPVALAIVDLHAGGAGSRPSFDELRQLKRLRPSVTRVLYVAMPPTRPHELFEAGRFGVDGLIVADVDDGPREILTTVEQAEARGMTAAVRAVMGQVRPTVRDAVLVAVTRAHQRLTPQQLADVLGIRRRALAERLEAAGYPPPQRLITWGRLLVAGQLLEERERSADSVALALDFPSGSAFRNTCQRYVRRTPLEIGRGGGAQLVLAALAEELRAGAEARSAPRAATPAALPAATPGAAPPR
jgi:AraC-like DNA-binding protein